MTMEGKTKRKDIQFCGPYMILFGKFNLQFGLLQMLAFINQEIILDIIIRTIIVFTVVHSLCDR